MTAMSSTWKAFSTVAGGRTTVEDGVPGAGAGVATDVVGATGVPGASTTVVVVGSVTTSTMPLASTAGAVAASAAPRAVMPPFAVFSASAETVAASAGVPRTVDESCSTEEFSARAEPPARSTPAMESDVASPDFM